MNCTYLKVFYTRVITIGKGARKKLFPFDFRRHRLNVRTKELNENKKTTTTMFLNVYARGMGLPING